MRLTVIVIDAETNKKHARDKKTLLTGPGQARLNTKAVRFVPPTMTLAEVTAPAEEGVLEVLDEETAEQWREEIRKRPEHELV